MSKKVIQNEISNGKITFFVIVSNLSVMDFDQIIIISKKKRFYHLKFHFGSLFSTFQKWHLEVHRTRFKEIKDKKLL